MLLPFVLIILHTFDAYVEESLTLGKEPKKT